MLTHSPELFSEKQAEYELLKNRPNKKTTQGELTCSELLLRVIVDGVMRGSYLCALLAAFVLGVGSPAEAESDSSAKPAKTKKIKSKKKKYSGKKHTKVVQIAPEEVDEHTKQLKAQWGELESKEKALEAQIREKRNNLSENEQEIKALKEELQREQKNQEFEALICEKCNKLSENEAIIKALEEELRQVQQNRDLLNVEYANACMELWQARQKQMEGTPEYARLRKALKKDFIRRIDKAVAYCEAVAASTGQDASAVQPQREAYEDVRKNIDFYADRLRYLGGYSVIVNAMSMPEGMVLYKCEIK